MNPFIYRGTASHVRFGRGSIASLPAAISDSGMARVLLLTTGSQADIAGQIRVAAGSVIVDTFGGAAMHTPVDVTDRAMAIVRDQRIDGVVALGGGSAIGLGKAIALRTGLPQIAIPTTYAGSEMTPIVGQTKNGLKTTERSPSILPGSVIYDADLTMHLPVALSGASGINAIAHAVEGLYARDTNPVMQLLAEDGIRALAGALPCLARAGSDAVARDDALYGAWLSGMVLGSVGMALHHKLCHTLGGSFALPHALTHAIVLPYVVAYNADAAPDAMERLARALGTTDPAGALFDLGRIMGLPAGLRHLGMAKDAVTEATNIALLHPYWNPRPIERDGIATLLAQAWAGERP